MAEAKYNESFTYLPDCPATPRRRACWRRTRWTDFGELGDRNGMGKALWGVVNSYVFDDDVEPGARSDR